MADRNSQIIMCKNIKLDRNYNNVLNYTETQMLSLCRANQVASASNYSFIRERGTIKTHFTYSQCLQSNYIAFQNPDYSNKWFFAWIDNVDYKSDGCGELSFTIDEWSTWFNKVNIADCFVVREHVNDDTIGLHTIPEGLETGDYVLYSHSRDIFNRGENMCIVIATTVKPTTGESIMMSMWNRLPSGFWYSYWNLSDVAGASDTIKALETAKEGSVYTVFLAPYWLAKAIDDYHEGAEIQTGYLVNNPAQVFTSLSPIDKLDGYTPKNNKMLTFPYCYFNISNCQGSDAIIKQELWEKVTQSYKDEIESTTHEGSVNVGEYCVKMEGVLCQGGSIRAYPTKYKGDDRCIEEGITLGKFPQVSWNSDAFTNWLTQNGVNIASDVAFAAISAGTGNVAAGALAASAINNADKKKAQIAQDNATMNTISQSRSIGSSLMQVAQASLVPPQSHGNTNSGDLMTATDENCLHVFRMTIKNEYAKIIDDYFTKFGYKVNSLKHPNITGRAIFNYVEIGSSEDIGYGEVPSKSMNIINGACRSGVTIWHNHANIGNYSLTNSII